MSGDELSIEQIGPVTRLLTSTRQVEDVLRVLIEHGMAGLDANASVIAVLAGDALRPIAYFGTAHRDIELLGSLELRLDLPLTTAARTREPVFVPDRRHAAERFPDLGSVTPDAKSWAAIPLVLDHELYGVLGVAFETERAFSDTDKQLMTVLADLCALGLSGCPSPTDPADRESDPAYGRVGAVQHLHEVVMNHLFSVTLSLAAIATLIEDGEPRNRVLSLIDHQDTIIREMREHAGNLASAAELGPR